MKRLASIACALTLVLCASMAQAEIFMGIMPGSSVSDLKRKFPNAKFEELTPAWLKRDERLIRIAGRGLEGRIVVKLDDRKPVWKSMFDKQNCSSEENRDSDYCNYLRVKIVSSTPDESYVPVWVRFIPYGQVKTRTIIRKYGKPDSIEITETFIKLVCWNVGVCAEVSDADPIENGTVESIVYDFTDADWEKAYHQIKLNSEGRTESSIQIGQGSRRE